MLNGVRVNMVPEISSVVSPAGGARVKNLFHSVYRAYSHLKRCCTCSYFIFSMSETAQVKIFPGIDFKIVFCKLYMYQHTFGSNYYLLFLYYLLTFFLLKLCAQCDGTGGTTHATPLTVLKTHADGPEVQRPLNGI